MLESTEFNLRCNFVLNLFQKRVEHLKKLAAVKINKEDVELIMRELEIPKLKAETCLRQANGDVVQALLDLIDN